MLIVCISNTKTFIMLSEEIDIKLFLSVLLRRAYAVIVGGVCVRSNFPYFLLTCDVAVHPNPM